MDLYWIIYDYFFANKEELRHSPFKLNESKDNYNPLVDLSNFKKVSIPLLAESFLLGYISFSDLNITTKFFSGALILSDIISREKGVKETGTYCYSLIGRARDLYSRIINK